MVDMSSPDLRKELDCLAVRAVELMGRLMKQKAELEAIMKGGFVDMAHARYSMGNKSVSALQINYSSMQAIRTVESGDTCDNDQVTFTKYSIVVAPKPIAQNLAEPEKLLRKRLNVTVEDNVDSISAATEKLSVRGEDETSFTDDGMHQQPSEKTAYVSQDPIHWFGVLVPQSLKACKIKFQQAVEMVGEIATTQSELDATKTRYQELRSRLLSQSLANKFDQTAVPTNA